MNRFRQAYGQFDFLLYEIKLIVNRRWWRWLTCWWGGSTGVLISYRLDRAGYLLFWPLWPAIRILFLPLFILIQLISFPHEIHYKAQVGRGLKILHPALGVVVSGQAIVGEHLTLTGGNCIGLRGNMTDSIFHIGNYVELGANAVILGPVRLGNHIQIGAGAVVISDHEEDDTVLIGVPARPFINQL
jgi:serine O-acetyltransferase